LVLRITLATGTTAVGIAVIAAGAGTYIAAMPKRTWSAVVLTVDESRPEASVYRVPVMPRRRAAAFIRATNASWLPASHRASPVVVALFAAGKARLGDVFYDGVAARADPLIDQWKRETAQKEEE
jgi:hypothetical protein